MIEVLQDGFGFLRSADANYLPGWRLFRLDKIFTYRPTLDNFYTMRPKYNSSGDRSMERVFINAKFDNEENIT